MREKLLELMQNRPFIPFRIELSSGTVHVIRHPDQAMLAQSLVFIGVPKSDSQGPDFADVAIVSLLHIVKLELLQTSSMAG